MNAIKPAIFCLIITTTIVAFWLAPLVNTSEQVTYVRIYEETDHELSAIKDHIPADTTKRTKNGEASLTKNERKFRKEAIRANQLKDIRPSTFSRAIHFIPAEIDSLNYSGILMDTIVSF